MTERERFTCWVSRPWRAGDSSVTRVGFSAVSPCVSRWLDVPPACSSQSREDPDAFADFYDAYAERVLVFFTRRVLDVEMAFDLLSETFAIALERRTQFRGVTPEQEQGWLFSIARSELLHYWRDGNVERSALARMGVPVPGLTDPQIERIEDRAGLSEVAAPLAEAMASLPVRPAARGRIARGRGARLRRGRAGARHHRAERPRPRLTGAARARARPAGAGNHLEEPRERPGPSRRPRTRPRSADRRVLHTLSRPTE